MVPYLDVLAKILEAVAWPLVVVVVLWTQRRSLSRILDRVEEISLPGGTSAKIRRALDEGARVAPPTQSRRGTPSEKQLEVASRVGRLALDADLSVVRDHMTELSREYERIRAALPSTWERAQKLEVVVNKMLALGYAGFFLLPDLTRSASVGDRMAAVAILQVRPDAQYLQWLAERMEIESNFVRYHTAVALQVAARSLEPPAHAAVRDAIERAKRTLGSAERRDDIYRLLESAEKELDTEPAGC